MKNKKNLNIQKNILLAPFTSFKIGGPADYFMKTDNEKELLKAINWAQEDNLPVFVLGKGTNLLISDQGFTGLVIKLDFKEIKRKDKKIIVGGSVLLSKVLEFCLKNNLAGLEWAAGIPGTIGGAVFGNAGAYKQSISNHVFRVKAVKLKPTPQIFSFKKSDLKFSYRHSIFKEKRNQYIITEVWLINFQKAKDNKSQELVQSRIKKRLVSQPPEPNAGCIFKNPCNQPAGFLIEKCGLRGYQINGAQISQKHANFIVNPEKKATAKDVLKLIKLIQSKVKKEFNINLELEIQYLE